MDGSNKDVGLDNGNVRYGKKKVDLGDVYNGGGNSNDDVGVDFGNGDSKFDCGNDRGSGDGGDKDDGSD